MCLGFPLSDNHIKCPTLLFIILLLVKGQTGKTCELSKQCYFPHRESVGEQKYFHVVLILPLNFNWFPVYN